MFFMTNSYILLHFTPLSPFATYKYNLGAWGKTTTTTKQQQRHNKH